MSTYTTNLNLIKPSYDDDIDVEQLNNNMDVLDTQVNNVMTVNNTQDTRLTALENKTYPYLPLTGGTVTGDLYVTGDVYVQNNIVKYVIEKIKDTSNTNYNLTAIKYSDGTLEQIIQSKVIGELDTTVTFLIPFTDITDITGSTITYKYESDDSRNYLYYDQLASFSRLTETGCFMKVSNAQTRITRILIGRWK